MDDDAVSSWRWSSSTSEPGVHLDLLLVLLLEGLQDNLLWKKNAWTCQKTKKKRKNKSICKAPFNSVIYKQQVIMNFL